MSTVKTLAIFSILAAVVPATASANCGPAAQRDPVNTATSLRQARIATLCLLNQQRRRHHLRALRLNAKLTRAGEAHARDMVSRKYFSHDTPSGQNFVQRVLATNYVPAADSYSLAENIAWGSAGLSSPAATVSSWMHSPGHRRNILMGGFREIGIGIVLGAPLQGENDGATYSTEFGALHRR
jgi:uncharacterized protein YkwD